MRAFTVSPRFTQTLNAMVRKQLQNLDSFSIEAHDLELRQACHARHADERMRPLRAWV
jgi:hypothetical protein